VEEEDRRCESDDDTSMDVFDAFIETKGSIKELPSTVRYFFLANLY